MCVCVCERERERLRPFTVQLKLSVLSIGYMPIQNKKFQVSKKINKIMVIADRDSFRPLMSKGQMKRETFSPDDT